MGSNAICTPQLSEAILGTESRYHLDWFRECADELEPILQRRNKLYSKWLATKCAENQRRFQLARGEAHRLIRDAKNQWFQEKEDEAQKARFGGKSVWKCIRDMQIWA